jgi:hypothetical protein
MAGDRAIQGGDYPLWGPITSAGGSCGAFPK